MFMKFNRKNIGNMSSKTIDIHSVVMMVLTFSITCFAWIFFRAESVTDAFKYIGIIFSDLSFGVNTFARTNVHLFTAFITSVAIIGLLAIEFRAYLKGRSRVINNTLVTYVIMFAILFMGAFKNQASFIYFQF